MDTLGLRTACWTSGPVLVASTFRQRWRGLRPRPEGRSMLLPGKSVHGVGMAEPLTVVGIDRAGRVVAIRLLQPWGVIVMSEARWLLEQPLAFPFPGRGEVLSIVKRCPDV